VNRCPSLIVPVSLIPTTFTQFIHPFLVNKRKNYCSKLRFKMLINTFFAHCCLAGSLHFNEILAPPKRVIGYYSSLGLNAGPLRILHAWRARKHHRFRRRKSHFLKDMRKQRRIFNEKLWRTVKFINGKGTKRRSLREYAYSKVKANKRLQN